MNDNLDHDLGPQPLAAIMAQLGLKAADLVKKSTEQLTFKMVARALKGRRLTPKIKYKVLNALSAASGKQFEMKDLFTY